MDDYVARPADQLDFLRRGGMVQRFHTHPRIKPEDDAQHTFGVVCMLYVLTKGNVGTDLIWACQFHDSAEHEVGDVPAPTKRKLGPAFTKMWNDAEDAELERVGLKFDLTPRDYDILKACDVMDGVFSCLEELERGNKLTATVPFRNFYRYGRELVDKCAKLATEHNHDVPEWVYRAVILLNSAQYRANITGVTV